MKRLFALALAAALALSIALPADAGLVTKPYTFTNGTQANATQVNADFDTLYTLVNGNISSANLGLSALSLAPAATTSVILTLNAPSGQSVDIYDYDLNSVKEEWMDSSGIVHFAQTFVSPNGMTAGSSTYGPTSASVAGTIAATGTIQAGSGSAYVPPVYNASGSALASTTHIVEGQTTITEGAGFSCLGSGSYPQFCAAQTITLSGAAAFTSQTTYSCSASVVSNTYGLTNFSTGVIGGISSGTQFSVVWQAIGVSGVGTVVLGYLCVGS